MVFILLMFVSVGFGQVPTSQKLDPSMVLKKADADGIIWFDPVDDPFDLMGFEWIEKDSTYRRLP
ncbi:MAG: hypothetical protein KAH12_01865, partial [Anaerolineales bacterium]|nr:hypothetical protein [Anaerolineales bacterium]